MAKPFRRTFKVKVSELDRLIELSGHNIESLARKSKIPDRTIRRIRSGQPGYLHTVRKLAESLGVEWSQLVERDTTPPTEPAREIGFVARLSIAGTLQSETSTPALARLLPELVAALERQGASVSGSHAEIRVDRHDGKPAESYFIFYGERDGEKGWIAVAVLSDYMLELRELAASGEVDLATLPYCRVLGSGWGDSPAELDEFVEKSEDIRPRYLQSRNSTVD